MSTAAARSGASPRHLKKRSKAPLIAVIVVIAVCVLLFIGYAGLCRWVRNNGLLMPGTVVSGLAENQSVDLSKMDTDSAAELLNQYLDTDLSERTLLIQYGENETIQLNAGDFLSTDLSIPILSALEVKENIPFFQLGRKWFRSGEDNLYPVSALAITEEGQLQIASLAAQIAEELYIAPVDFSYEVTELTVELILGTDGQEADVAEIEEMISEALLNGAKTVEITATVTFSAELTGEILSELVYLAPQSPFLDENGELTPTVIGYSIDPEEAQMILDETGAGEACSIPLIFTQPDLEESEDLLYQDVLSSSETYMSGTNERRTNITLAAAAVNGTIVMPGETFSFNNTVGERTAEKGYQEATVYVQGEDKLELGGGICQLASALYNCTLYADLQVVSRTAHRFAVTYVPYGLDATVAWGSIDYKFKNTTDYPIRISATTSGSNLIVKFYGTKVNNNYVKMETTELDVIPYETVYEIDETLSAGQTSDLVHAYTGYEYDSYRCVYDGSGKLISRTYEAHSTYAMRNKVIGVSPADAARYGLAEEEVPVQEEPAVPEPEPSSEPEQEQEPEPEQDSDPVLEEGETIPEVPASSEIPEVSSVLE